MRNLIILVSLLAPAACGGGSGSGIPDSTNLADLSEAEVESLCREFAASFPPREVTCNGETIELGVDAAECDEPQEPFPATCEATVGDFRDCFDAIEALSDDEICTLEEPPVECEIVFSDGCES